MSVRLPALSFGALVVGSVIVVDPRGLAPFGPARWLVVSTLALATIALALRHGRVRCHRTTWWMWIALLSVLTLSALINDDVKVALIGHPDRHLGAITWVLFFGMYCAGQQLAEQAMTAARAIAIAAAAVGLYSLWELVLGPPIAIATTTRRLLGPFGSAAFLGAACCLLGPIAIGVAFDRSQGRRWQWLGGFAAACVTIAAVGSGTRAAWIGAAFAAVLVVIGVRPSLRNVLLCGAGLLIAVALVAPRLDEVSTRRDGSSSRLDEWRVAGRVIAGYPLIGVGPEGYRIAVADGIDDAYERVYRRDTVLPDRAHSGPLDVTLAGGLGAGVLYVALLGFVGWRCWRLMRSRRPLAVGIGAAVIAYGVQQLLLFPLPELDPIWWAFAGIVVTMTSLDVVDVDAVPPRRTAVPALAGAAAVLMLVAGVLDVAADRQARTALRTTDRGAAIDAADRAVSLRPDNLRYRLVAAEAYLDEGTLADIDRAIAQAQRATDWSPHDPFATDELATALSRRAAATGDSDDVAAALAEWEQLVDRDPHRALWQLQLGRAAAMAGQSERAREAWTIAAGLGEPGAAQLLEALKATP